MPIPKKVLNFLDKNKVKYKTLEHRKVYTAIDKAKTLKIKESLVGKTVVLKFDRDYAIVLMSSDKIVDIQKIKKILNIQKKKENKKTVKKISFAGEKWIKLNIKGIKQGSVPPFGNLWKLPIIADLAFLKNKKIILNSGDHYSSLELTPAVFKKLIPELIVGSFAKKRPAKKKKKKK